MLFHLISNEFWLMNQVLYKCITRPPCNHRCCIKLIMIFVISSLEIISTQAPKRVSFSSGSSSSGLVTRKARSLDEYQVTKKYQKGDLLCSLYVLFLVCLSYLCCCYMLVGLSCI